MSGSTDGVGAAGEPRILFVTGTDTGVGKTHVSTGIVRALVRAGARVAVRKPMETGCAEIGGHRHPADGAALRAAAGAVESLDHVCPMRFSAPLAPLAAAGLEGRTIDPASVVSACRHGTGGFDWLVVEGAGGLLVPITRTWSFADLAAELGAGVVVVVGARLGAINHALLTLEVARNRGLNLLGWVVNHPFGVADLAASSLRAALSELTTAPCLGEVEFGQEARVPLPALAPA